MHGDHAVHSIFMGHHAAIMVIFNKSAILNRKEVGAVRLQPVVTVRIVAAIL